MQIQRKADDKMILDHSAKSPGQTQDSTMANPRNFLALYHLTHLLALVVSLSDFDVSHQATPCARVQDVYHSSHQVIHIDTMLLLCPGWAPL
jgi:hypothetical protein